MARQTGREAKAPPRGGSAWRRVSWFLLFPGVNYLLRLRDRMAKVVAPNDPLLAMVREAYDAMHRLYVEMHYRLCEGGVGRGPAESQK